MQPSFLLFLYHFLAQLAKVYMLLKVIIHILPTNVSSLVD
jgi:hypothetical protein